MLATPPLPDDGDLLSPAESLAEAAALECAWDGAMPPDVRARWRECLGGHARRTAAPFSLAELEAEHAELRRRSRDGWACIKRCAREMRRARALAVLCGADIARQWRYSAKLQQNELCHLIAGFAATRRRLREVDDQIARRSAQSAGQA
jgi:hypothetical protein